MRGLAVVVVLALVVAVVQGEDVQAMVPRVAGVGKGTTLRALSIRQLIGGGTQVQPNSSNPPSGTVGTSQLVDLAVTTAKLAANAVTTAKLGLLSVTTAVLDDLAVTTAKLAANAVTSAKCAASLVTDLLGYTPANKAGDTFTGDVAVQKDQNAVTVQTLKNANSDTAAKVRQDLISGSTKLKTHVHCSGWSASGVFVGNAVVVEQEAGGDMRWWLNAATGEYVWYNGLAGTRRMTIDALGHVSIGTSAPDASSALRVDSTNGAFLPPRMTEAQRDALTAIDGMIVYNSTTGALNYRKAGAWVAI